jgi:hypothetical protein
MTIYSAMLALSISRPFPLASILGRVSCLMRTLDPAGPLRFRLQRLPAAICGSRDESASEIFCHAKDRPRIVPVRDMTETEPQRSFPARGCNFRL